MELVEAARIDGAHEFRIFNQIVLPLMKPAIAVQAIFTFVSSWNNYFIPSLLLNKDSKKTLPILIAQLRSADFLKFDMGKVYMMLGCAILPVIIVYLCLSKIYCTGRYTWRCERLRVKIQFKIRDLQKITRKASVFCKSGYFIAGK